MKCLAAIVLISLSFAVRCAWAEPSKLTIAAASDLKFAMDDLVKTFKQQHPEATVDVVTGSSGKFYEQIVHEAPFDLFFSADTKFPQQLKEQGLAASEVHLYARGQLALWSASMDAGKMDLKSLARPAIKKIAIANPKHAPYGMRAQEALEHEGVWQKIQDKLVLGENIAQTAQFAESGAADVGIIALSLAVSPTMKNKGHYSLVPENLHSPLDQGFVILKKAENNTLAKAFADYVDSQPARTVLRGYGFVLPGESAPKAARKK
ncbi:MAG: molybdate transporter substrate-binding protein [Proteobacteria bacterium]|nr:molybdate transporter substrate-binding protein [Pseudomonadota bacterium]